MRPYALLPLVAVMLRATPVLAQDDAPRPAAIRDNSFLLEEAYNQERGVVQHISMYTRARDGGAWAYTFTQEWPVAGQRHQVSFTVPVVQPAVATGARRSVGDVALHYRYQLTGLHGERIASAPRLTLLLPTGSVANETGAGGAAVQASLPLTAQLSEHFVTHLNAGATFTPSARAVGGASGRTTSYGLAQSLVWLATSRVNALMEVAFASVERVTDAGTTEREQEVLVSPGVRWAYSLAHGTQIVPGLALPIGIGPSRGSNAALLYFSVEHPF